MPEITENHPLKSLTTFQIGGAARYFASPGTEEELLRTLGWARSGGVPVFMLGGGSNVLISDSGVPGLVIKLAGGFGRISFAREAGVAGIVTAGAAVRLPELATSLADAGLKGMEFLAGIPGTVGGAVRMNAGTAEGEIGGFLIRARVLGPELEARELTREEMGFGYRTSVLAGTADMVLGAVFACGGSDEPDAIRARMKQLIETRRQRQPSVPRNAGSIFKNPPGGRPAGWYIEQAGLKGLRAGDAEISPEHANWIVNLGGAGSSDVMELVEAASRAVKDGFGIELQRELQYIPEDLGWQARSDG